MTPLEIATIAFRVYQYVERLKEINTQRELQGWPTLTEDQFLAHVAAVEAAGGDWLIAHPAK